MVFRGLGLRVPEMARVRQKHAKADEDSHFLDRLKLVPLHTLLHWSNGSITSSQYSSFCSTYCGACINSKIDVKYLFYMYRTLNHMQANNAEPWYSPALGTISKISFQNYPEEQQLR